jgi:hypothetical protein
MPTGMYRRPHLIGKRQDADRVIERIRGVTA